VLGPQDELHLQLLEHVKHIAILDTEFKTDVRHWHVSLGRWGKRPLANDTPSLSPQAFIANDFAAPT
jgi:hypothetical protein